MRFFVRLLFRTARFACLETLANLPTMPARAPKPAKKTQTVSAKTRSRTPKNKNGGPAAKATPGEIGRSATNTRINAFVSSRARRTQAKRDAR